MACGSRARSGRRSLTDPLYLIDNDLLLVLFCIAKRYTELCRAPASQATPRDTEHLKKIQSWQRGVYVQWNMRLPWYGHDPRPVRRGLVPAVKCCVRKARFFLRFPGTEEEKPEPCVGFNTTKGKA